MECGLQWKDITCWDTVPRLTVTHEETLETAIADYCPDLGRIVETAGQLCLRSVTAQSGTVELRGSVRVTVLYTSEESLGLRCLTQNVPFLCTAENRTMAACKVFWATGRLLLCEARALTPRRLSLRVMPEWTVSAFRPVTLRLCTGVEEEPTIRLRQRQQEVTLTTALAERECSFTGDAAVPDGQSAPEELLLCRLSPRVSTCQTVGTKLLVKGELTLFTVYRCQQQQLHTYTTTLPFSQIVDSPASGEEGEVTACPQLICGEARLLRTEETTGFSVTAELRLLLHVTRQETITCVTDLYSTRWETKLETAELSLPAARALPGTHQEAAQHLELGNRQPFVCVTDVDCGGGGAGEDGRPGAAVRMRLLYLDEEGTPAVTERTVAVPLREGETASLSGMAEVVYTGSGCDLRQMLEITPPPEPEQTIATVTAVELREDSGQARRPSLVLRRLGQGESLWDVAKRYRTDEALIREVNRLEDDAEPEKMLLIPRVR